MVKDILSLVEEAQKRIPSLTPAEVENLSQQKAVLVDVRDIRELWQQGKIIGALHSPRGMLEFWIDPASPYHRKIFAQPRKFVFYCSKGWRSALAAQTAADMGLDAAHLAGGYEAWMKFGGPTEKILQKDYKATTKEQS